MQTIAVVVICFLVTISLTQTITTTQTPRPSVSATSTVTASQKAEITGPCEAFDIKGLKITGNATVFGSNIGLPAYPFNTVCNRGSSGTSWYKIEPGLNANLTISTCFPYTNFDTLLGIYTGFCENLVCSFYNDDSTGCSGGSSFLSIEGTTETEYYISVSGYTGGEGQFQLFVSSTSGFHQECESAISVPGPYFTPVNIDGNTQLYGKGTLMRSCGLNVQSSVVWYRLNPSGSGGLLTVSACNVITNFDAQISVFSGSCTSLECMSVSTNICSLPDGLNTGMSISFTPLPDTSYYVVVHGVGDESGYYQIKIFEESVNELNN